MLVSYRSFPCQAQTTSSQTIISHVSTYCQECPQNIRDWVTTLQKRENESCRNNTYGSRKVFFDRVWSRMHQQREENNTKDESTHEGGENDKKRSAEEMAKTEGESVPVAGAESPPKKHSNVASVQGHL